MAKVVLYEDPLRSERIEIEAPVEVRLDVGAAARELGLPPYLALDDDQVVRAVGVLYGCRGSAPAEAGAVQGPAPALPVALFGGLAVRFLCPSCNERGGPFRRKPNDLDLVTVKTHGRQVVNSLLGLGERLGSRFTHVIRQTDRNFNAMRAGERYRLLAVKTVEPDGRPVPEITDILCDKLPFCHTLDVGPALAEAERNHRTIGLENLLLSKLQFITSVPRDKVGEADQPRELGDLGRSEVLLGMEPKDCRDVLALVHDHEIGGGPEQIDPDRLVTPLRRAWGFHRTVSLNLGNLTARLGCHAESLGLTGEQVDRLGPRLEALLEVLQTAQPRRPLTALGATWWERVEETTPHL